MVRKGEIVCDKQSFLFSQCFPKVYIFSSSKCGNVWYWTNTNKFYLRCLTPVQMVYLNGISNSHTMTPFDGSGNEAF